MADLVIDGQTIEAIVMPNGEELELGKNPTGNIDITQAGVTDVSEYATATVPQAFPLISYEFSYYTVSGTGNRRYRFRPYAKTFEDDPEYPSGYFRTAGNYYGSSLTGATIPTNTHVTPTTSAQTIGGADTMLEGAITVDAVPSATFDAIEDNFFVTRNGQRKWHNEGYVSVRTSGWAEELDVYVPIDTEYNAIPTNTTVTPTETAQTIGGANTMMEAAVTVAAIPSNYVGSGITRRSSTDLTASGATVSVPSGFYENNASKAVASGTEGTPTATKGTVSNHAISVTPSVTNSAGYISGGTHTGTAVSVSASELVSGTINITASGNTDVTNYATASVASGGATASATKGTVTNHSVTVTPSVTRTAGYVTAGTASGTAVTVSASELVSGSETKTANGTYNVTNLASLVVAVPIVTYYTGSSAPSSSLGSNGDIYLQS